MLLAIDIGNSNISVGLFGKGRDLKFLASIETDSRKTAAAPTPAPIRSALI